MVAEIIKFAFRGQCPIVNIHDEATWPCMKLAPSDEKVAEPAPVASVLDLVAAQLKAAKKAEQKAAVAKSKPTTPAEHRAHAAEWVVKMAPYLGDDDEGPEESGGQLRLRM